MTENRPAAPDPTERRFPRRFLIGVPATAAAATVAGVAGAPSAEAAPANSAWKLGGNAGVAASNWLGTKNAAALIIKTSNGGTPVERMRVQPNGRVGIGTAAPGNVLDVKGAAANEGVVRATLTSQGASSGAFRGIAAHAGGFGGWFSGRGGGVWAQGLGNSTQGVFATGTYGVRAVGDDIGVRGAGPIGVQAVGQGNDSTGVDASGDENGVRADGFYGVAGYGEVALQGIGAQYGLYGISSQTAIFCSGDPAGYFEGDVTVTGTLERVAATTRIDHPLDPERRWLTHASVESAERKNVYDGTVVLDDQGQATVELPAYVSALNHNFRYQLTCVGAHAPVYVARRLRRGVFRIAGGTPGLEVCWQVTGTRRDDYARAHPVHVETDKSAAERGTRVFVPAGSAARKMPTGMVRRNGRLTDPRTASRRTPSGGR